MLEASGERVPQPGDLPCLLQVAACSALCNDSTLCYAADRAPPLTPRSGGAPAAGHGLGGTGAGAGAYQRIGESTEVALRVLAEKVRGSWHSSTGSCM